MSRNGQTFVETNLLTRGTGYECIQSRRAFNRFFFRHFFFHYRVWVPSRWSRGKRREGSWKNLVSHYGPTVWPVFCPFLQCHGLLPLRLHLVSGVYWIGSGIGLLRKLLPLTQAGFCRKTFQEGVDLLTSCGCCPFLPHLLPHSLPSFLPPSLPMRRLLYLLLAVAYCQCLKTSFMRKELPSL